MVQFKEELITPKLAKEMLSKNIGNRQVNQKVVDKYAWDINAGMWQQGTGETIKVSLTGKILDGQHRLYAIIKADTALPLFICSGLKDEVFTVLDTGLNRSAKDVMFISGALNATVLPSIIQSWYNVKSKKTRTKKTSLTNQRVLDIYNETPDEWQDIVRKSKNFYNGFSQILQRSVIGALYKSFSDKAGTDIADDFFTQLCYGKEFSNETLIWLRKRLTEDKISNLKLPSPTKYALIIKTWNCFRKGINNKSLRITGDTEDIL